MKQRPDSAPQVADGRQVRRWTWALLAISAAAVALGVVLALVAMRLPWPDDADLAFVLVGMPATLVGLVLVVRQPTNLVGKLLVLIGAAWLLGEASRVYLWIGLHEAVPALDVAAWLMSWLFAPAWMLVPVLLAVFPSGMAASRRLRLLVKLYIPVVVVMALVGMLVPQSLGVYGEYLADYHNPLGNEALGAAEATPVGLVVDAGSSIAVLLLAFASVVDLVSRWRASTGVLRLQIRAFALGAVAMITLFAIGAVLATVSAPKLAENLATTAALSAPPLAVGMAVLRYRLYDIDRLVSRTATYGLVVALLVGVYSTVAVGLPRVLGVGEGSPLRVAAATLAAAALFNPLRRRVQDRVDRRFNRRRLDATREVDRFAARVRSELELEVLTDDIVEVARRAVEPNGVSVWIRDRSA